MSTIRVEDVAFVRFRVPDLERQKAFLLDFGLAPVDEGRTDRIVARGAGPAPVAYVAEQGDAGFAGLAFRAASLPDLEALAAATGAPVQPLELPGGGSAVVLADPDGHRVEVVAGQTAVEPTATPVRPAWNGVGAYARTHAVKRVGGGPAHVVRLGHCVLNVSDFRASERWYKDLFGLITSDEIEAAPGFSIGAFMRCDRGETPTDHHTLFLVQSPKGPGFNHAAFEVADFDDLMTGHDHLAAGGHQPEWGVGRHILGSQVFDYWRDPWGHTLEHWTDGDLLSVSDGSNVASLQDLMGVQWGPSAPPTMA